MIKSYKKEIGKKEKWGKNEPKSLLSCLQSASGLYRIN